MGCLDGFRQFQVFQCFLGGGGMRVLFVDDEIDILEQAKIFLEKELDQLSVETVVSAKEALDLLEEKTFDVVVSDYQMPEMDGLEFLETVREDKDSEIPFIIFTGKGREEVAMKALNLGANRYLQKGGSPKSQYGVLAQSIVQEVKHARGTLERKKVEAKLSSIVRGSEDPIYIVDEDCRITFANQAELEKTGMEFGEIIGLEFGESHPEEDARDFEEKVKKALETGKSQRQEVEHEDSGRFYDRTITPVEDPRTGMMNRAAVISKDVTERKKREKELEESEERYRRLFETAQDGMLIVDAETGEIKDANPFIQDILGYSKEELLGRELGEIGTFRNFAENRARFKELVDEGYIRYEDLPLETKEGKEVPVEFVSNTYEAGGEKVLQCNIREISERKKRKEKLQKEKKRFQEIFNNVNDAIYLHELTEDGTPGEFIEVNDVACEMLGYSRDEFMEMSPQDIDSSKKSDEIPEVMEELFEKGDVRFEMLHQAKDGTEIPVEIHSHLFELEGEERVLSVARDISERKGAEEDLKLYKKGLEASGDSIYMIDVDGRYVFANDEHLSRLYEDGRISRKDEVEVVGRKYRDIHPDEDSKGLEANLEKVIETGEVRVEEHEFSSMDRWSSRTYSPIENPESGDIEGVIIVSKDITNQKEAEKREEFLHSLLRHDVRNKAQIAKGYFELLDEEDLSERGRDFLEKTEKACDEAVEIIEKVRKLRDVEKGSEIREVSLAEVIDVVVDEHKDQLSEKNIELECKDDKRKVMAGPLLEELFSNLIENAIRHSDCSNIRIYGRDQGAGCIVTVEDDGCGISDEDKEKIFEKGYRKSERVGSGLGLYMVKEIAENYGGGVKVRDSDLGGVRFDVYLKNVHKGG